MAPKNELNGANVFKEGFNHQVFVSLNIHIYELPVILGDVGIHRLIVGLGEGACQLKGMLARIRIV